MAMAQPKKSEFEILLEVGNIFQIEDAWQVIEENMPSGLNRLAKASELVPKIEYKDIKMLGLPESQEYGCQIFGFHSVESLLCERLISRKSRTALGMVYPEIDINLLQEKAKQFLSENTNSQTMIQPPPPPQEDDQKDDKGKIAELYKNTQILLQTLESIHTTAGTDVQACGVEMHLESGVQNDLWMEYEYYKHILQNMESRWTTWITEELVRACQNNAIKASWFKHDLERLKADITLLQDIQDRLGKLEHCPSNPRETPEEATVSGCNLREAGPGPKFELGPDDPNIQQALKSLESEDVQIDKELFTFFAEAYTWDQPCRYVCIFTKPQPGRQATYGCSYSAFKLPSLKNHVKACHPTALASDLMALVCNACQKVMKSDGMFAIHLSAMHCTEYLSPSGDHSEVTQFSENELGNQILKLATSLSIEGSFGEKNLQKAFVELLENWATCFFCEKYFGKATKLVKHLIDAHVKKQVSN